ncbi:LacI family DNA-binding transcriptional regulator [Lysobacter korlensis]|uniref:LacI family DNA-binding transcriptional regulator n=1 Tax=Lysobacter korlensis TaxID=553636 RepID=A0ABV6RX39_9GAMM
MSETPLDESAVGDGRPGRAARTAAPTIYDIAKLAGVNPSTVSRALSRPGRINVRTEERIRAAAKELNYRVNPIARALPTGRTRTLGLLVADITNPVVFGIVRGAEHAATERGYTLVIAESEESGEREAVTAERILPSVDGVILATTRLGDPQIRRIAERKPVVLLNRVVEGVECILPDLEVGVTAAVQHLNDLGHRRLVYLAGPATSWISRKRGELITAAATERGMTVEQVDGGTPTLDAGREAFDEVRVRDATAVFSYNDLMAIGLLREAGRRGTPVPEIFSLIGFDDIFGSDFTVPPLTTIRSPLDRAGRRAVLTILGEEDEEDAVLLTELVVRSSTAPPSA